MDDLRRRTIIAEIENWRKNNLLPEHYCIFLLNLYTEGERPASSPSSARKEGKVWGGSSGHSGESVAASYTGPAGTATAYHQVHAAETRYAISWKMLLAWLIGASFIAGIILLAFHFNRFTTSMQIAIFTCFAIFFYILALASRHRSAPLTHLSLAVTFLILLLGGFFVADELNASQPDMLLYLTAVCLFWCVNGFIFGYAYLLYCGFFGLADRKSVV